jgi:hypothetical protein
MRLIAALAVVLCVNASASAETLRTLGGKLGPTEPVDVFTATRDHILVSGLPKNWGAAAGQCSTAVPAQYPKLKFTFHDGNTSTQALEAAGYTISTGAYGLPATSLTLCRDSGGKIASVAAQVAMLGSSGGDLSVYVVNTTNTSATDGSSYSELAVTNFQEEQSFTASSGALNSVVVSP